MGDRIFLIVCDLLLGAGLGASIGYWLTPECTEVRQPEHVELLRSPDGSPCVGLVYPGEILYYGCNEEHLGRGAGL